MALWTTNYPTSLDTLTEQPAVANHVDTVDDSQINSLSTAIRSLESKVGSNLVETDSLRDKVTHFYQKWVLLTWGGISTIYVTALPSENYVTYFRLQDHIWRSFTGTLTFDPSISGEGGLCHGGGQDTGTEVADVWYYLYLVPKAIDDTLLTVIGSCYVPAPISSGPVGYSNYIYIGAVRNVSSNLKSFIHTDKTKFSWIESIVEVSSATWDVAPVQLTLTYVPLTASAVEIILGAQGGTSASQGTYRVWVDKGSAPTDTVDQTVMCVNGYNTSQQYTTESGTVPLITRQSIYYRKTQISGSWYAAFLSTVGWIDLYLV
jgi:hypothetical protein